MKTIIFIPILFLFTSCSTIHKVRNAVFNHSKTQERTQKDSISIRLIDSLGVTRKNSVWQQQHELVYERMIEEEIVTMNKDSLALPDSLPFPASGPLREGGGTVHIKRRIFERGMNTRIGKLETTRKDSTRLNTSAQVMDKELQERDSTGTAFKEVITKKTTGIRWYLWLIAGALAAAVIWWKGKKKIISFFS